MNVNALREQRTAKVAEMRSLVETAETAGRDLAENERARFDALKAETAGLEERIGRAEHLANMERHAEATPVGRYAGTIEIESRFSIGKALAEFSETGRLTGAEAEYAAEHRSGRQGSFAVPVSLFLGSPERRAELTTSPVAGPAGNLISTTLGPLIQPLRPVLKVQSMGCTVLPGLTGNLDLPRLSPAGSVAWVPEHTDVPPVDANFDRVDMSPKTVGAYYEISRRMLLQAPAIEGILRADLAFRLAQALDGAALVGAAPNGPSGIASDPNVPVIPFPTAPTLITLTGFTAAMIAALADANVAGPTGFVSNTEVKKFASTLYTPQSVPFDMFHGERIEYTNQVPRNFGVTTDKSALIYGDWQSLVLGYWSSVDLVLNPYADSVALKGGVLLLAFLDADVGLRHPQSFSVCKDFDTTLLQ